MQAENDDLKRFYLQLLPYANNIAFRKFLYDEIKRINMDELIKSNKKRK